MRMNTSGWGEEDCSAKDKRPCTNTWRKKGTEVSGAPESLSDPGWTASRCGGESYLAATSEEDDNFVQVLPDMLPMTT